jgi:hypothetical protein
MNLIIEDNFIDLQKKAMHLLVQQKAMFSEEERISAFLDKSSGIRNAHTELIAGYYIVIELVVTFLEKSHTTEELTSILESINNLVVTINLIKSFSDDKLRDRFVSEIKAYEIILSDINEISIDIKNRIACDSEMEGLLNFLVK